MKKYKSVIVVIILLLCLTFCIIILKSVYLNNDSANSNKICNNIKYSDVVFEINYSLNSNYVEVTDIFDKIDFSVDSEYIVFADKDINSIENKIDDNYFIILKNINNVNLFELNNFVFFNNLNSDTKLGIEQHGNYTYMISSKDNYSVIDGMMRSFIYCN